MPIVDPCLEQPSFSWSRLLLFTLLFLVFLPGGMILFFVLYGTPFGVQAASVLSYTAGAMLYTFSSNKGMPRYLFLCPFVRSELSRLALRHCYFLAVLIVLQTTAIHLRSYLSPYWLAADGRSKSMPPFVTALLVTCLALLLIEVLTNRSLLERSHRLLRKALSEPVIQ
jgi:hypothetical protein